LKNYFILLVLTLALFSCTGELASYEFESYKWIRNSPVNLNFTSESKGKQDLVLEVRSIYGFNHPNLDLEFVLTQPNGQTFTTTKKLTFEKDVMDCSGDFCDQLITICDDFEFLEGAYSISVKPLNCDNDLLGFMEFRLIRK
jgi:hypothetical protein